MPLRVVYAPAMPEGRMTLALAKVQTESDRISVGQFIARSAHRDLLPYDEVGRYLSECFDMLDREQRIKYVLFQHANKDSWVLSLDCRERDGVVTKRHTVRITSAGLLMGLEYDITGASKYQHEKEILSFIEAQTRAVLGLKVSQWRNKPKQ